MSTKLAALVLVPTVVAVLLGAIGIIAVLPGGGSGGSVAALVWLAVVLTVGLAATALAGYAVSKRIVDSLQQLRSSAADIADDKLPTTVEHIQEHGDVDSEVAPIPVRGADEVGDVARVFDRIHHRAVRLATDQVAMRTAYGNVFVNLSRRSQSLVQRQLQLIERLERDEEDSEQLATLFQLDHLATRMRRNNENLLVISGGESGRRPTQPISVTDVLRAAVSEIEQYQRVAVKTAPDTRVIGHAASDLMRLIAELLDNATAFSAPETHVTLATRVTTEHSLSIDVIDKGIGMNAAEVDEANNRIGEAASMDLSTSRRMGLFVVGRLAGKHGFRVTIHGGSEIGGVRANIVIPESVLAGRASAGPLQTAQTDDTPATRQEGAGGGSLPRRTRGPTSPAGATPFSPSEVSGTSDSASGTVLFTPNATEGDAEEQSRAQPRQEHPHGASVAEHRDSDGNVPAVTAVSPSSPPPASSRSAPEGEPEASSPDVAGDDDGQPHVDEAGTSAESPAEPAAESKAESGVRAEGSKDDLPAGEELFASNNASLTQWWTAATAKSSEQTDEPSGSAEPVRSTEETTPIFNAMLSAWFRSDAGTDTRADAGAGADDSAEPGDIGWEFAADRERRTAESLSQAEPASYTESGLPRRRKGAQLLPGSAGEAAAQQETPDHSGSGAGSDRKLPMRDPGDVAGRLSKFQQGIHRGRQRGGDETTTAGSGSARTDPTPSHPAASDGRGQADVSMPSGQEWDFASDENARQVHSAGATQPDSYTESGLPRRRRGQKLQPGSATQSETVPGPRSERDADTVRGRLSSFQQGVRRGRHQSAHPGDGQPADGRDNHEHMEGE